MNCNKICHLTTVHEPFDDRIFHKECRIAAHNGNEVVLIARHETFERVKGVQIVPLPMPKNRFQRIVGLTLKAFHLALKQKADIYHFHDPELIPIGVLLKILFRKNVIYDVHEDYSKQILSKLYLPRIFRKSMALLVKLTEYVFSKCLDGVITATDDIKKNFSHHERTASVKNYPVLSYFSDINKAAERDENRAFKLVYAGNLSKTRSIIEMVQSLEHINDPVKLVLYGEFYPADYGTNVTNLKGFEKTEYIGWVEHEKVVKLLGNYDAGIVCLYPISNYLTALPVKMFEYMAAGLPVIASNFPILKEIIEGNKCGICVDPLDPEDIAKAIEYLMKYPRERREMGENGKRAVSEKYNWERESGKLFAMYQEVLNDH